MPKFIISSMESASAECLASVSDKLHNNHDSINTQYKSASYNITIKNSSCFQRQLNIHFCCQFRLQH